MDDVRISRGCLIPAGELTFRFSRSSGPGGQNVNKRDTQVELIFDLAKSPSLGPVQRSRALSRLASRLDTRGRLHVVAAQERSQSRNREIAVDRFARLLEDALRPPPKRRRATRPSKTAIDRRILTKRRRSEIKRGRARPEDD